MASPRDVTPSPATPDGRYIVVRGRLWRRANPALGETERQALVEALMAARRDVRAALAADDATALATARGRVDAAKRGLGERGPVWWSDGAPDLGRRMARNTPYADWWAEVEREAREAAARADRSTGSGQPCPAA